MKFLPRLSPIIERRNDNFFLEKILEKEKLSQPTVKIPDRFTDRWTRERRIEPVYWQYRGTAGDLRKHRRLRNTVFRMNRELERSPHLSPPFLCNGFEDRLPLREIFAEPLIFSTSIISPPIFSNRRTFLLNQFKIVFISRIRSRISILQIFFIFQVDGFLDGEKLQLNRLIWTRMQRYDLLLFHHTSIDKKK